MDVLLERLDELEDCKVVVEADGVGLTDPEFVIGRANDCSLQLDNKFVSRHHCELIVDERENAVRVRDLGSQNGTFVNDGQVTQERELKNGDKLVVGCIPFEVHIWGRSGTNPND
ncbi:MAG TPA: FHA domain-containing protein [Planctomycetaceae bacterium]